MLFMVIERFEGGDPVPVYRRLKEAGRGLPEGVTFVDSWFSADLSRCFQLMESDDVASLQQWVLHWRGCGVSFEIIPVVRGAETRGVVEPMLGD